MRVQIQVAVEIMTLVHVSLQIQAAVNATMAALTAAGVVFVPFDSGSFTEVANIAWDGGPESDDYMEPEAIAR